jgi:hypothetical protein
MNTKVIAFTGVVLVATVASAEQPLHPGSRGTVTAYEVDDRTVIEVRACSMHGYAHDYGGCGDTLRADVRAILCARGRGVHSWVYQISDGAHLPSTVFCR